LPHHKLIAHRLACELAQLIVQTRISNAKLREQARKSAGQAVLNIAEGAARTSQADKSRVFGIALAEACEAAAAVEVAALLGACSPSAVPPVVALACRVKDVLSRLMR
jgi:four helix bundle protein